MLFIDEEYIEKLIEISREAGKAIMDIYNTDFKVATKQDKSPLTEADMISHKIISTSLFKLTPKIPVLSEESSNISLSERSKWDKYWLIDPLDGTKEFINKNGEFTTNIALIEENKPTFGIIFSPVLDEIYWGSSNEGSFMLRGDSMNDIKKIQVSEQSNTSVKIVTSRSHPSNDLSNLIEKIEAHEIIQIGSSLKFCLIAQGKADLYPRLGPTSEWDIAAGHAILKFAGGIIKILSGTEPEYNKRNLLNPYFIAGNNKNLLEQVTEKILI